MFLFYLMPSVDRSAMLIDKQQADIFHCDNFDTDTLSNADY
jgi:hypothetical protein